MEFSIEGPILDTDRAGFREWLSENHSSAPECWLDVRMGRPADGTFCYIDAVEEALCFGWIDSVQKKVDGRTLRRFSPRRPGGHWTELNRARVRRLEKLGLMTDAGRAVVPVTDTVPRPDRNLRRWFSQNPDMYERFMSYPELYRNVQLSNLEYYREYLPSEYRKRLKTFRKRIEEDRMIPGWDDYGRLTERSPPPACGPPL